MVLEVSPGLDEVRTLAANHDLVPVVVELGADLDTAVAVMLRMGTEPSSFLFESVVGGEQVARYSFIGHEPDLTFEFHNGGVTRTCGGQVTTAACDDPLACMHEELARRRVAPLSRPAVPFTGGAAGYLSYEAAACYEDLPAPREDPLRLPLAWFGIYTTIIVFDHAMSSVYLITHVEARDPRGVDAAYSDAVTKLETLVERLDQWPGDALRRTAAVHRPDRDDAVVENMSRDHFMAAVDNCREYILSGDIYQVQMSRRFSLPLRVQPFDLYRRMRSLNPSPYMFYLATPSATLVGTSPELLVRVTDGRIQYHPLAGTRRRGRTPADDLRMEQELRGSEKEAAEHMMLVDLGRNDVGRVSEIGSVSVPHMMEVERYSHVMHLRSSVQGTLRGDLNAVDALRACFPAGTVTGAPKLRAMEIIAEQETEARGIYAGTVGYLGFNGNLDTALALRTVVVSGGMAYVQAAGGIVADSTPEEEALEIDNKAAAALLAVRLANAAAG